MRRAAPRRRSSSSRSRSRSCLLTGAGLVLRSFANLLAVDPGFTDRARADARHRGARRSLSKVGGALRRSIVRAFEAIRSSAGCRGGRHRRGDAADRQQLDGRLRAAGTPGRAPASDRPMSAGRAPAADTSVRCRFRFAPGRLFSDADSSLEPAGRDRQRSHPAQVFRGRERRRPQRQSSDGQAEIVGVVGDIRRAALTDEPRADMYFAAEQEPQTSTTLFVRTSGDPLDLVAPLRTALRSIEPSIVLAGDYRRMDRRGARVGAGDAAGAVAARPVRGDGAGAGGCGDLRCHVVRREAAHAGDRYARRARRDSRAASSGWCSGRAPAWPRSALHRVSRPPGLPAACCEDFFTAPHRPIPRSSIGAASRAVRDRDPRRATCRHAAPPGSIRRRRWQHSPSSSTSARLDVARAGR